MSKAAISLTTGLEDPERVTVAFLVAVGAAESGRETTMFLTKEAVRLAVDGVARGVACDGCPPLPTLLSRYAAAGGTMIVCGICVDQGARPVDLPRQRPQGWVRPAVGVDRRRGGHDLQLLRLGAAGAVARDITRDPPDDRGVSGPSAGLADHARRRALLRERDLPPRVGSALIAALAARHPAVEQLTADLEAGLARLHDPAMERPAAWTLANMAFARGRVDTSAPARGRRGR